MKYEITLGKSKRNLTLESTMSLEDVLLMIANDFGDEWYGCCVVCKEKSSFYCNAVESYYTGRNEDGSYDKYYSFPTEYMKRTVKDWAMEQYCNYLKVRNNHFNLSYDPYDNSKTWTPIENIFEEVDE